MTVRLHQCNVNINFIAAASQGASCIKQWMLMMITVIFSCWGVGPNKKNCDSQKWGFPSWKKTNLGEVIHVFSYWLGWLDPKNYFLGISEASSSVGFGSVEISPQGIFRAWSKYPPNHKSTTNTQVACCLNPGNGMGLEISLDVFF